MLLLCALAGTASAITVTVGGVNPDYSSLADAVNDANHSNITEIDLAGPSWGDGGNGDVAIEGLNQPLRIEGNNFLALLPQLTITSSDVTVADSVLGGFVVTAITSFNSDLTLENDSATGVDLVDYQTGGTLVITGGLYTLCTGHVVLGSNADITVDGGALFLLNTSYNDGAAFNLLGGTLDVEDAQFAYNGASDFGQGGAIYAQDLSSVTVGPLAVFDSNTAEHGGAMSVHDYLGQPTVFTINGATFTGNLASKALGLGGALYVSGISTFQSDFATFSGTVGYAEASAGGAWYLTGVASATGTGNAFTALDTIAAGGAIGAEGDTVLSLDDTVATDTTTGDFGVGGFLYSLGADVTLTGGSFTGGAAQYGGFAYSGLASRLEVSLVDVAGGSADGGSAIKADRALSLTVTDSALHDGVSAGAGGAITVANTASTAIVRNALCGNVDRGEGAAALTVEAGAEVTNNRIWNNVGLAASIGVADAQSAATFDHNSLVDNDGDALQISGGDVATVTWNLFAPGGGNAAISLPGDATGAVGSNNFVEDGAQAPPDWLGAVGGTPMFQETRPFTCDSLLWVHWDDPVLVDYAAGPADAADIDGSALDYGAWGGPSSYPPGASFDDDADGVRNDLDCAIDDPTMFPGGPVDTDCDCDSDGDGSVQPSCADGGPADCNEADPSIHPGAADDPTDGVDSDCDGVPDLGNGGLDTGGPAGEDLVPGACEDKGCPVFFGGGGCATAPAPLGWLGLVFAAAAVRRSRRS